MQALQQELSLKDAGVKDLLEKGKRLVEDASPSAEVQAISDTLGELQGEWERIQQEAAEREKRLTAADSHAQHFSEHLDKLNMWLNMMEEKLDKVKLSDMNKKDIEQTLKDLQVRAVWLIGWLAWWLAGWIRKLELSDYLLYVFSCACFCLFVWGFCVCVHLKLILSYLSVF